MIAVMNGDPQRRRRWSGRFSLILPAKWTVESVEGRMQILPPDGGGAVHISYFRREPARAPQPGEAIRLLERLERGEGITDHPAMETLDGEVLTAAHRMIDGAIVMEVWARVWAKGAVLFTFTHQRQPRERIREAIGILDSIDPA